MAKRGEFFPYRVTYAYPNGAKGRIPMRSVWTTALNCAVILRRGGSMRVLEIDRATRAERLIITLTPDVLPERGEDDCTIYQDTDIVEDLINKEV